MSYFKVSAKGYTLAYYAEAPNKETAVRKVERLSGPIKASERVVREVTKQDIPEGETIL